LYNITSIHLATGLAMLEYQVDDNAPPIAALPLEGKALLPNTDDLASMTVDELWKHRERIETILAQKIAAELEHLKARLELLSARANTDKRARKRSNSSAEQRRPYPSVLPKYRNPKKPSETWSGRGRQPHWVQRQLGSGKQLEDLLIG
jgi:DNA-binding protein H-NS